MNLQEAYELAQEIALDPEFVIDKIERFSSNTTDTYAIRLIIRYSNTIHWINDLENWEWVRQNLSNHPKGTWTPESDMGVLCCEICLKRYTERERSEGRTKDGLYGTTPCGHLWVVVNYNSLKLQMEKQKSSRSAS